METVDVSSFGNYYYEEEEEEEEDNFSTDLKYGSILTLVKVVRGKNKKSSKIACLNFLTGI